MSPSDFSAELVHLDGRAVVAVGGELDVVSGAALWEVVQKAIAANPHVVLDFGRVSFIDSSGLAILVRARKLAAKEGGSCILESPSPQVARVLEITGLDKIFLRGNPSVPADGMS